MKLVLKLALPLLSSALILLAFACLQPARDLYGCDPAAGDSGNGCLEGEICLPESICRPANGDGGNPDSGEPDSGDPDGGAPDGSEPDGGEPDGSEPDGGTDGGPDLCASITCVNPDPVCNPLDGSCGPCSTDSSCTDPTVGLACRIDGHCVECVDSDPHCVGAGNGSVCDSALNLCVECLGDGDCTDGVIGLNCDLGTSTCFVCGTGGDCDTGLGEICNAGVCEPDPSLDGGMGDAGPDGGDLDAGFDDGGTDGGDPCSSSSECLADPLKPVCDTVQGSCVFCTFNEGCGPAAPVCLEASEPRECTGCSFPTDCPAGYDVCTTAFQCECSTSPVCVAAGNDYLFCSGGACIQCFVSGDCPAALAPRVHCDNGMCVECLDASNCSGNPCINGVCQP